jgi:hypothetical protein
MPSLGSRVGPGRAMSPASEKGGRHGWTEPRFASMSPRSGPCALPARSTLRPGKLIHGGPGDPERRAGARQVSFAAPRKAATYTRGRIIDLYHLRRLAGGCLRRHPPVPRRPRHICPHSRQRCTRRPVGAVPAGPRPCDQLKRIGGILGSEVLADRPDRLIEQREPLGARSRPDSTSVRRGRRCV